MKFILKQDKISFSSIVKSVFILLFIIYLSSCGKTLNYCEDNPEQCDLLMRDSGWSIDSLKIDGIDSLSVFIQHPYYCNTYKFDNLTGNQYIIGNECNSGSQNILGGWWSLINKENFYISFYDSYFSSYGPLFRGEWWSIDELTDQTLKISIAYKNKNYLVHFKAK